MWQQTAVGVLAVVVLLCTIRAHAIEGVEDRPLNVLLVTYPFSMLHPTVALAVEMCRRGHHTVIAGHDGKVQRQVDKVNASYREELAAGCGAIEFQSLGKMPFSDAEVKDIRKKVCTVSTGRVASSTREERLTNVAGQRHHGEASADGSGYGAVQYIG